MDLHTHRKWQGAWHTLDGTEYYFFAGKDLYPPNRAHLPGFWTGAEGLAHPVRNRSGTKYVLKSFTILCDERDRRMRWLCHQRLGDCAGVPLLSGAPTAYLGPPVNAQLCPFVEGKTWETWKSDEVTLTADQRLYLAFSLAAAVKLLEEGLTLCHSDLSPGNVIIDLGAKARPPSLSLIDFDAFHHAAVPTLPVGQGQTLGTPGYQAPEFVAANQVIRTDRFGMAVLIHEFLALGEDRDLGEPDYRFFEQEDLNQRKAGPTSRFKNYWGGQVFDLVKTALRAARTKDRPAPEEWCDAFITLGASPKKGGLLMTAERNGKRQRFDLKSTSINLADALGDAAVPLVLQRAGDGYQVMHWAGHRTHVAVLEHPPRTGKHISLNAKPVDVLPGAVIVVGGWKLSFHAKQE